MNTGTQIFLVLVIAIPAFLGIAATIWVCIDFNKLMKDCDEWRIERDKSHKDFIERMRND